MIRERRNKEKLTAYYSKFMEEGLVDTNVHPWVETSWLRCRNLNLQTENLSGLTRLNKTELTSLLKANASVIKFVDGLFDQVRNHFAAHNMSMLLLDELGYGLKEYNAAYFPKTQLGDVVGWRLQEKDIGTSSISVAMERGTAFLMFGPEMWIKQCHGFDYFSGPVNVNGKVRYIISFSCPDQNELPYDLLLSLLMTMKFALEQFLSRMEYWGINQLMMSELPVSVFWVDQNEKIKFCNDNARARMEGKERMEDVFLNYEHIPVRKALEGVPTHRREITWITQDRTYEDITTVVPVKVGREVNSAVVLTMSIEDLKTTIAHATGYSSRYSLYSMVGQTAEFLSLQHKASRIARGEQNMLLQGEPGTGKQRLAHGIHQASPRAAAPLIVVKCTNGPQEYLSEQFFGSLDKDNQPIAGKLELAMGGTLFLDEIEKLPVEMGDSIADALKNGLPSLEKGGKERKKLNVRVIAACDSNLKRLADKGLFSRNLYEMVIDTVIRIPPLRERVKDIEVIANHILAEMSAQHNMAAKKLAPKALAMLTSCRWPGNIKQLQGVIEQAFFHTPGSIIEAEDIKLPGDKAMEKSWKTDEDAFIAAWKAAGGNISKLAGMLDVSRVTLYRYLKKYKLGPNSEEKTAEGNADKKILK